MSEGKAKACTACSKELPLSSFHRDARSRDGRRSRCSSCISSRAREDALKEPVVDPLMTHKECPRCDREGRPSLLPLRAFGVARRRKDGKNSWCKSCCSEASLAWQKTEVGRIKHIEAVKRYRERMRFRGVPCS